MIDILRVREVRAMYLSYPLLLFRRGRFSPVLFKGKGKDTSCRREEFLM